MLRIIGRIWERRCAPVWVRRAKHAAMGGKIGVRWRGVKMAQKKYTACGWSNFLTARSGIWGAWITIVLIDNIKRIGASFGIAEQ